MNRRYATRLLVVALFVTLHVSSVEAGGLSAVINGKSIHMDAAEDWNEENYGIGVEYRFSSPSAWKKQLMVNGFRDSNDDMSYMVGGGLHRSLFTTERWNGFYVDAGINAFLMTRQDVNDNRPFPGVLPSMTIGNRHVGMNLTYLPRFAVEHVYDEGMTDESMSGIVFLQIKLDISRFLPAD